MRFKRLLAPLLILFSLTIVGFLAFHGRFNSQFREHRVHACDVETAAVCLPYPSVPGIAGAEELARKFAPIVYLPAHGPVCDPRGTYFDPIPVDAVLNSPLVALRRASDHSLIVDGPSGADLYQAGAFSYFDTYLDFPGDPTGGNCRFERDARRLADEYGNVMYARVTRQDGFAGLVLQYWFFYYFNPWNNKHEGDWEMIQLHFDVETVAAALQAEPVHIALSQHGNGEVAPWTHRKVEKIGSRPVVYVATGSHANHFAPKVYIGRGEQRSGLGCDDASESNRFVPLETRLIPRSLTGSSDPFAWVEYKGYWGELAGYESDGSSAPVTKQNWVKPVSWQNGLRSSSVTLPLRDTVGPNAVRTFCDVVALGSDFLLPLYRNLPAATIVAFSVLSIGAAGSLTKTHFRPTTVWPLRARRRLGQVLTSSLEIYRRKADVFLGLGLLFLPIGLLISATYAFLLDVVPVHAVLPLPDHGIGRQVLWAFALTQLHFGFAYALVIATASTAVVASLERTPAANTEMALGALWRRLPHLVIPRLLAILAISLLALSIIGIPLAIRQTVQWTFLEEAVLLDGKSGRGAFGQSSHVVATDWWWSAAAILALGFFALFGASLIGIILLMTLQSIPLEYVNLMTSAVYVVVVPYIAIAHSLLYFELQARRSATVAAPRRSTALGRLAGALSLVKHG